MIIETWIVMLIKKLKYLSSLLRLDTFVDIFVGACIS
jgi:hypothetical protein